MKKAATKKAKPAAAPVDETATIEEVATGSASPVKCLRPFRHEGRLYETGKVYTDVPRAVLKRFAHRFGDSKG